MKFKQCLLINESGAKTYSWIPIECAIKNEMVDLAESSSEPKELWRVLEVYPNTVLDQAALFELQKQVRNTRKASDI